MINVQCLILVKTEIKCLISFQFGREVLDIAASVAKPGVTTDEIDRVVHEVGVCCLRL